MVFLFSVESRPKLAFWEISCGKNTEVFQLSRQFVNGQKFDTFTTRTDQKKKKKSLRIFLLFMSARDESMEKKKKKACFTTEMRQLLVARCYYFGNALRHLQICTQLMNEWKLGRLKLVEKTNGQTSSVSENLVSLFVQELM